MQGKGKREKGREKRGEGGIHGGKRCELGQWAGE
jgi:hypothetical protein